jgi:hypothetical protein
MNALQITTLALATGLLTACSAPPPYDQTHQGELSDSDPKVRQDNSPYDDYEVPVDEGWTITAEMRSDAFDSYLWLLGPDGTSRVQDDDGLGDGTQHSRITFTADTRGTYVVRANSYDGTGRGAYQLHVTARPASGQ